MKLKLLKLTILFLFVTVCTNAQEKKSASPTNAKLVTIFDGNSPINMYLMEGYIAEIGISSEKNSKVKSLDSSAIPVRNIGFAQVFKVADSSLLNSGKISTKAAKSGKFSAVYSRSGDDSSLILPAGIIVTYKISVSETQIAELEKKYALKPGKKLPIEIATMFSYEAEPGQDSIGNANALRGESIVQSTSVDFIEERVRR